MPGEIGELPPVVDDSDVKVDIEDEQKTILDLENIKIQESVEIFDEKQSHNDIVSTVIHSVITLLKLEVEEKLPVSNWRIKLIKLKSFKSTDR